MGGAAEPVPQLDESGARGDGGRVPRGVLTPVPDGVEPARQPAPADVVAIGHHARLRRAAGPYVKWLKPMLDAVVASALVVFLFPVCLAIALAIRLTMGRGVLFRQVRVGKHGKPFEVLKFRTMRHDRRKRHTAIDIEDRRRTHKHPNDPRITRVGRFLRTSSLDELPQLVNVLRGEMSLIGPRPELEDLVNRYEPWQHARHAVRPGMTGLWQVEARGEQAMHECVHLDLEYVERVSLLLDLRIALTTPVAALGRHRGA
jgi:lipopolysaccharide/colanic/teichoic acid biosynthesis glycosyltransferase